MDNQSWKPLKLDPSKISRYMVEYECRSDTCKHVQCTYAMTILCSTVQKKYITPPHTHLHSPWWVHWAGWISPLAHTAPWVASVSLWWSLPPRLVGRDAGGHPCSPCQSQRTPHPQGELWCACNGGSGNILCIIISTIYNLCKYKRVYWIMSKKERLISTIVPEFIISGGCTGVLLPLPPPLYSHWILSLGVCTPRAESWNEHCVLVVN